MLETCRKIIIGKKTCIIVVMILLFGIMYVYTTVSRLKQEREKIIKDYDGKDNFTNYFSYDEDNEMGIQQYLSNIGKIINMRKQIRKWNANLKLPIKEEIMKKVPLVIVVQVHNRPLYLLEFLRSLQTVLGVMNSIIVFSHDFYDEDLNRFIEQIRFVTVVQIFYPYSKQLHPNVFPGDDKKFCVEGWFCKKAKNGQRNSTLAQLKHHWWWKVNYVFDKLDLIKTYNGLVVFLEEDEFVTEDFMYVLKILDRARKSSCHQCDILCVGAYPPVLSKYSVNSTLIIEEFGSTPFSMGIAFNRTAWNKIKKLRRHFCYYDDYDWLSSLRYLTSRLPEGRLNMLTIAGPRVMHFGRCGVTSQDTNCDVSEKIDILHNFVELVRSNLFPKSFVVKPSKRYTKVKKNGNFSDVRDHELCMYISRDVK